MADSVEYLGLIRFSGTGVHDGYLDARLSAEALLGFDEAIRYFVSVQSSELSQIDYEIPVRIRAGSWEALIPHDIASWVQTALGTSITTYLMTAAKRMADRDFENVGFTDIFRKSLHGLVWIIRLGKHLGTLAQRSFEHVQWAKENTEVGIPNERGDILFVPVFVLQFLKDLPRRLLMKLASVVSETRILEVVVRDGNEEIVEVLSAKQKAIFCPEDDAVLFPELEHGMNVTLDGIITRGNENANTLGFQYKDHILSCFPKSGSVVRFKPALFLRSRIRGTVTRADRSGLPVEPRPKIMISEVDALETDSTAKMIQPLLFDNVE